MRKIMLICAIAMALFFVGFAKRNAVAATDYGRINASPVVMVSIYFEGVRTPTEHMVLGTEWQKFVYATLRLHYVPGVNPHNNVHTARASRIVIKYLRASGPYWWSTPHLEKSFDPAGASILSWSQSIEIFNRRNNVVPPFFNNAQSYIE